jgi:hypothetical protein
MDQTPTWTGDHTWDDGSGNSPALHLIPENNDDWQIWVANDATPGNSDLLIKFPAADTDALILFRDSGDNDVAYIDADGNTTWDGASHRFGIADTVSAIVTISGHATGSDEGGQFTLELADDHDGTFNSWNIDVYQDDLRFFRSDAGVVNQMTAEGQLQLPTTGSGAGVLIGGDAQWYRSAANQMATPDDVYFAGAGLGIIHVDGNTAGWVLRGNGTRYVPGAIQSGDVPGMDAQFVTMAVSADLANERVLTGGDSLTLTDGGAGGNATLDLDTPGTLTVSTANNATAPHLHTITSSSNPGVAASILATDGSGDISIQDLYVAQFVIHAGDTDTTMRFQDDQISFNVGGFNYIDMVEGASDYIQYNVASRFQANFLYLDGDNDSYLRATGDDVVDFVLAGASGELGITINGAEDFTFTANAFNVLTGSAIYLSEYMYHAGDTDTYMRFQTDQITLRAGGVDIIDIVEGATDYIKAETEVRVGSGAIYVEIRSTGDLTSEADIWMGGDGGISAEGSLYALIDSDNSGTAAVFEVAKDADARESAVSGTQLWTVFEDSTTMMRDGGVEHQADSVFKEVDVFFQTQIAESGAGGVAILGGKDSAGVAGAAVQILGLLDENADTTKTTSGRAIVEIHGGSQSGGGWGDVVADGN